MKLTQQQMAQEIIRLQNASNCNTLLHTLCDRVNDNSYVLNYEHPIVIAWLDKIANMIGGIQSSDMNIAKTETPVAQEDFHVLLEQLKMRLDHVNFQHVKEDAKIISIVIQLIGLSGGNNPEMVENAYIHCKKMTNGEE